MKSRQRPVRQDRRNQADTPSPKGKWVGPREVPARGGIRHPHRVRGSNLPRPQLLCRQLGKPHASRVGGIPTVRKGDGAGGRRGRRKRRPPCNGADRAVERQRYPTRKGADVRLVLAVKNLSSARSIGEVRRRDCSLNGPMRRPHPCGPGAPGPRRRRRYGGCQSGFTEPPKAGNGRRSKAI